MRSIESTIPLLELRVGEAYFDCPYCHKRWVRPSAFPTDNRPEVFVKTSAEAHLLGCRRLALFDEGYVLRTGEEFDRALLIRDAWPDEVRAAKALRRLRGSWVPHKPYGP